MRWARARGYRRLARCRGRNTARVYAGSVAQRQDQGPDFELRIRARPEQLQHVRHALGSWLDGQGAAPDVGAEIALAVHEAAANVVEHAYPGDDGAPSRTDQRGRGLALMHGLMDDVEITGIEDGSGTRVTLRRRVRPG